MTIAELNKEIFTVILNSTETEVDITETTHLIRDMGLSSVEVMMMISDLEDWFDIEIPPSRLRQVQTVGDLCQTVLNILRKQ